jgi:hypothetical protein
MHPEFIRALARQRQADLLHQQHLHRHEVVDTSPGSSAGNRIDHVRRSVGAALVVAGTRLMPPNRASTEWFHASREGTVR